MSDRVQQLIAEIIEAGCTAGQLARCLYVHESTLSRWRSGERTPSRRDVLELQRIHRFIGASVEVPSTGEAGVTSTGTAGAA